MTERRVAVAGGEVFARADGGADEALPWIVLSNSLAADHRMWDPQVALLRRRHRVLRYDARGHGASDVIGGDWGFPALVADAVAVMDAFGVERATFMGLSLGGMTGLGVALAHPDRLTRLVCCDARADAPEPFRASWDDRIAAIENGGMAAILGGTLERWLSPAFRAAEPGAAERIAAMILATPVAGYAACARALKTLDYRKDLGRVAVPTLFVVGEEDAGAPPAVMRDMAGAVAGARLTVVPGSGHLPNVDNAAGFEAAVAEFLELR